jgi:hypothetical protein
MPGKAVAPRRLGARQSRTLAALLVLAATVQYWLPAPPPLFALHAASSAGKGPASRWRCNDFGLMITRLDANGDVQCLTWPWAETDGQPTCYGTRVDYELSQKQCRAYAASPPRGSGVLSCGRQHAKYWGGTGYDEDGHWCILAQEELQGLGG